MHVKRNKSQENFINIDRDSLSTQALIEEIAKIYQTKPPALT